MSELSMNVLSLCLEYDLHRTIEEGGKAVRIYVKLKFAGLKLNLTLLVWNET